MDFINNLNSIYSKVKPSFSGFTDNIQGILRKRLEEELAAKEALEAKALENTIVAPRPVKVPPAKPVPATQENTHLVTQEPRSPISNNKPLFEPDIIDDPEISISKREMRNMERNARKDIRDARSDKRRADWDAKKEGWKADWDTKKKGWKADWENTKQELKDRPYTGVGDVFSDIGMAVANIGASVNHQKSDLEPFRKGREKFFTEQELARYKDPTSNESRQVQEMLYTLDPEARAEKRYDNTSYWAAKEMGLGNLITKDKNNIDDYLARSSAIEERGRAKARQDEEKKYRESFTSITTTNKRLDEFLEATKKMGVVDKLSNVSGMTRSKDAAMWETLRKSLFAAISNDIANQKGVLSDQDVQRAEDMLGKTWENYESAKTKIKQIKNFFIQALEDAKNKRLYTPIEASESPLYAPTPVLTTGQTTKQVSTPKQASISDDDKKALDKVFN
jgi:hypothetical protein